MTQRPPTSTLFPYTTLFRAGRPRARGARRAAGLPTAPPRRQGRRGSRRRAGPPGRRASRAPSRVPRPSGGGPWRQGTSDISGRTRCYVRRMPAPDPAPRPRGVRGQFLGILAARALGSLLQAVALVVLARSVPAAEFGFVNVVIAVVGIVLVATGLGLSLFVPFARARGEADALAAALRLNTTTNVLSALVLVPAVAVWAAANGAPAGAVLIGASLALERNVDTLLGVPVADGDAKV